MRYRYFLTCPRCGKRGEAVKERRVALRVNCGDCLMDHIEIVTMTIDRVVEEEESDNGV